MRVSTGPLLVAIVALVAIGLAVSALREAARGIVEQPLAIGDTPATVFRPAGKALGPVVVIAHGFAGSQQLMRSFADTFARNGYTAVTFDFPGHGRNPRPLTGDLTDETEATRVLVDEVRKVADVARTLGDGRLVVLGHSMASDIVVRYAESDPAVAATIAVSMFSPAVTATAPRNLLVIAGDWEAGLKREALRAVALAAGGTAEPAVTYGDPARGTGRRAVFSPHVEHVGVLYSRTSLAEALAWTDRTFGIERGTAPAIDGRGPWILVLLAGVIALALPLSTLLPVVSRPPAGAGLGWRRLWPVLIVPAVVTPVVLRVLPTHFLPVLVADYLAAHFLAYGLVSLACLVWIRRGESGGAPTATSRGALLVGAAAATAYMLAVLGSAIDLTFTSFVPGPGRMPVIAAMAVGALAFFLADEWATRGPGAGRGAYAASKAAFLLSLALAMALDFERLFFLVIIVPVIVPFFVVAGLFSRWLYRRTGHPLVAGFANALLFASAIGVTFPMIAR